MEEGSTGVASNVFAAVDVSSLSSFAETTAIAGLAVTLIFVGWSLAKKALNRSAS